MSLAVVGTIANVAVVVVHGQRLAHCKLPMVDRPTPPDDLQLRTGRIPQFEHSSFASPVGHSA